MNNIISVLIEISMTSSILILVVLLIRKLFKNKISAVVKYSLWLIVLLPLLMPYSISSPISVMNIFDFNKLQTANNIETNPAQKINNDIGTEIVNGDIGNEQLKIDIKNAQTNGNARLDTSTVLISIWAVGIIIMTVYMLVLNIVYLTKIHKNSRIFPSDKLFLLEKICADLKIKKRIPVVVNDKISSPCLVGWFKPKIIVTSHALENEKTMNHVLLHELCHFKQKDNWISLFRNTCCAIYWFNPFVWVAAVVSVC